MDWIDKMATQEVRAALHQEKRAWLDIQRAKRELERAEQRLREAAQRAWDACEFASVEFAGDVLVGRGESVQYSRAEHPDCQWRTLDGCPHVTLEDAIKHAADLIKGARKCSTK